MSDDASPMDFTMALIIGLIVLVSVLVLIFFRADIIGWWNNVLPSYNTNQGDEPVKDISGQADQTFSKFCLADIMADCNDPIKLDKVCIFSYEPTFSNNYGGWLVSYLNKTKYKVIDTDLAGSSLRGTCAEKARVLVISSMDSKNNIIYSSVSANVGITRLMGLKAVKIK